MTAVAAPRLPGHLPSTGDVGVNGVIILLLRIINYYQMVWIKAVKKLILRKT